MYYNQRVTHLLERMRIDVLLILESMIIMLWLNCIRVFSCGRTISQAQQQEWFQRGRRPTRPNVARTRSNSVELMCLPIAVIACVIITLLLYCNSCMWEETIEFSIILITSLHLNNKNDFRKQRRAAWRNIAQTRSFSAEFVWFAREFAGQVQLHKCLTQKQ